ncbi:MAG: beta-ketoacyl-ACP synthase [Pseudopedobacter saltans]|uniref:3-oxoacyl-[acyl-carrier-protein] synthase 1 n=1 Tax=Pseudopedobacter saltans TaxID=151895 RepID=A0A2W5F3V8_9SPHI|nr:MAG: beta-ketoacyl-ACP synthase [Pseudopedobacter saltans]
MGRIMDDKRIVITGMGVVSPNGIGTIAFDKALRTGKSGIRKLKCLEELGFRCQVAGVPPMSMRSKKVKRFLDEHQIPEIKSSGILYGLIALIEAWKNARLDILNRFDSKLRIGCFFGTGSNGAETTERIIDVIDGDFLRSNESQEFIQCMASAVSVYANRLLNLNGPVTTFSSACITGTESLIQAYNYIKNGIADIIVVGSSESADPYVWSPFDAMFATAQNKYDNPSKTSCPLSQNTSGFVPSAGAGVLVVESLESALKRNARIYAELLGGHVNSGGQRDGGSMTIGNLEGMQRCIVNTLKETSLFSRDIDLISGHLTSTIGDVYEIKSWVNALGLEKDLFPYINSTKSLIGHSLSASGTIESIASILQLEGNYIHPSINAFPLNEEISSLISLSKIPYEKSIAYNLKTILKISFGFGDINACIALRKYNID